jgi:excisionase family DNA binding protein
MSEKTTAEPLWDSQDVANYLKASRSFVYKAIDQRTIPFLRIGGLVRFKPEAVRAFAEGKPIPR